MSNKKDIRHLRLVKFIAKPNCLRGKCRPNNHSIWRHLQHRFKRGTARIDIKLIVQCMSEMDIDIREFLECMFNSGHDRAPILPGNSARSRNDQIEFLCQWYCRSMYIITVSHFSQYAFHRFPAWFRDTSPIMQHTVHCAGWDTCHLGYILDLYLPGHINTRIIWVYSNHRMELSPFLTCCRSVRQCCQNRMRSGYRRYSRGDECQWRHCPDIRRLCVCTYIRLLFN